MPRAEQQSSTRCQETACRWIILNTLAESWPVVGHGLHLLSDGEMSAEGKEGKGGEGRGVEERDRRDRHRIKTLVHVATQRSLGKRLIGFSLKYPYKSCSTIPTNTA